LGWQLTGELMGLPALALKLKHHGGEGEKAVVLVEMTGPNGELRGHHPVPDADGLME
jgi:hypothetical protein